MKEKKRCSQNKQNLYPLFKGQESRFYSALSIIHYCPKFPVQKPTRGSSVRAKLPGKKEVVLSAPILRGIPIHYGVGSRDKVRRFHFPSEI
ncbi:hypothetical protein CEXT_405371 [Caerostris extrusa]|uniref:Uncharacterized protein n=1 Tax=Caerostris extrusa TaxID=172846 RepID=A0AAV4S8T7_CAEEX|nr:hypothetical protein CEXT_405371 [Caerostris extrusa]